MADSWMSFKEKAKYMFKYVYFCTYTHILTKQTISKTGRINYCDYVLTLTIDSL